ncbi:hypothetical protein U3516DRAFT_787083 [Neocallimastix sp. 'constans']|jgi:hypothetical protein
MGFFFKSKRSSANINKTKHIYASEIDPVAYLSETPTSPKPTSPLFSESSGTNTKKSLLDDILDTFDDKKTTSTYTSNYNTRGTTDYDFLKSDSNRNTYTSKYSTSKYDTNKYSTGSTYANNDSYKRVYKLGSERSGSDSDKKYDSKYSSYTSSPTTNTSSDKETYSIYTRYLQNEDKKDDPYSSTKYTSYNDRYNTNTNSSTNRYGNTDNTYTSKYSSTDNTYTNKYSSNDNTYTNKYSSNDNTYTSKYSSNDNTYTSKYSSNNYTSKYSSNNDNIYSSKYTPASTNSTTTAYKWTSSTNSNRYSTNDDERRNRFDDERKSRFDDIRSRFEDKYSSSNNLFEDKPERPSWKTSLFQERSRSETRFNEIDNRGKTPAQILKELRERNLESIKQKQKELNGDDEEEEIKTETVTKPEPKPEPRKIILDDSDSDSDSEDLNVDRVDDDDDDIPLNILEGGGDNKMNMNINTNILPKDILKPMLKKKGSRASIMSNKTNITTKNSETNSLSTNNNKSKNKNETCKPEVPVSPIKEGITRSSSTSSLNRLAKPTKKPSFSRSSSKTRVTKHASLIPPVIPSPLVNQIKPLPSAIQMPVMGQQIIAASPLVQPAVMVAPSPSVMQPVQPMPPVMIPQFPQQFQPIFVNPGVQKPFMPSPKLKAKTIAPTKKGNKKKKAAKRTSVSKKTDSPVSSTEE